MEALKVWYTKNLVNLGEYWYDYFIGFLIIPIDFGWLVVGSGSIDLLLLETLIEFKCFPTHYQVTPNWGLIGSSSILLF